METLFWLLAGLFIFGYVGYPILATFLGFFSTKKSSWQACYKQLPRTAIIISAYNEQASIARKIQALLNQTYPANKMIILVVDDGSQDNTAALVEAIQDKRVHLLKCQRMGKANAINHGVSQLADDIEVLVFTDADNEWEKDTLMNLMAPFQDQQVGAAGAKLLQPVKGAKLGLGDVIYRRYEGFIKVMETKIGSCVSLDGAALAIRCKLYEQVPPDVTDDFFISSTAIKRGYRTVFCPSAIVRDASVTNKADNQFRRRVRVTVRGMQSLWKRRQLMNPWQYGMYSLSIISHKLIRRCASLFIAALLPVNALLIQEGAFYQWTLGLQVFFYSLALISFVFRARNLPKALHILSYVFLSNVAVIVGLFKFAFGVRYSMWNPEQNR